MEDVKKQEDSSDSNGPTSADEKKDSKEVGRTSSTSKGAGLGEEEDDDEEEITDSPYSDSKEFEPIQVVYLSGNITKSNPRPHPPQLNVNITEAGLCAVISGSGGGV